LATKRKRRSSGSKPRAGSGAATGASASAKPSAKASTKAGTARRKPDPPPPRRSSTAVRIAAIAAAIALGWLLFYRTSSPGEISAEARAAARAAGCGDLEQPAIADPSRTHLAPGETYDYPDPPAAAGPHDPSPLPPDPHVYPQPVPETRAVHNLEHAYVIVYYLPTAQGGPSGEVIRRLSALANADERVIMAPYPTLTAERGLALLAWNTRWLCPASVTPDQAVAIAGGFIDAFRGTSIAPEAPRGLLGPLLQP
jgi:Protein of unknown function (DUF3105)